MRRSAIAALGLAALVGCGGSTARVVGPTSTKTTAPDALREPFVASVSAMRSATSFAFTAEVHTGPRTVLLAGEFSAPSNVHETITAAGNPPTEIILIGSAAYRRTATGTWVAGAQPATAAAGDPRAPFDALLRAEHLASTGGGTTFEVSGDAARTLAGAKATKVSGTVTTSAGAISRLDYAADDPQHTSVHLTYTSVGSSPPVTAPKTA